MILIQNKYNSLVLSQFSTYFSNALKNSAFPAILSLNKMIPLSPRWGRGEIRTIFLPRELLLMFGLFQAGLESYPQTSPQRWWCMLGYFSHFHMGMVLLSIYQSEQLKANTFSSSNHSPAISTGLKPYKIKVWYNSTLHQFWAPGFQWKRQTFYFMKKE